MQSISTNSSSNLAKGSGASLMNIKGSGASLMEVGGVKSSGASLFMQHPGFHTVTPDLATSNMKAPQQSAIHKKSADMASNP
jgi:hypothetical protein